MRTVPATSQRHGRVRVDTSTRCDMVPKSIPAVGDTVGYAKPFLRSIHAPATDPMWLARGVVTEIKSYAFKIGPAKEIAYVKGFPTDREDGIAHVLISNIEVRYA